MIPSKIGNCSKCKRGELFEFGPYESVDREFNKVVKYDVWRSFCGNAMCDFQDSRMTRKWTDLEVGKTV